MQWLMARLDAFLDWLTTPQNQRGLAYARSGLGWITLYIYTVNYAQRHFLLGPQAVYTNSGHFNLFYGAGPAGFEVLYTLAIVAALCFALGIGGRLTTLVNFLFFWSWSNATTLVGDGGDNILRIMLFYLLFADLYQRLRPGATTLWRQVLAITHNFALLAVALQLSMLYLTAGLQKVQGEMWREGTALYYILQVDEFSNPALARLFLNNLPLVVFATYGTIFMQLAYPWLLLHLRTKRLAVVAMATLHLGILMTMNLISFSLIMITLELTLLPDTDYVRVGTWIRRLRNSLWLHRRQLPAGGS